MHNGFKLHSFETGHDATWLTILAPFLLLSPDVWRMNSQISLKSSGFSNLLLTLCSNFQYNQTNFKLVQQAAGVNTDIVNFKYENVLINKFSCCKNIQFSSSVCYKILILLKVKGQHEFHQSILMCKTFQTGIETHLKKKKNKLLHFICR